MQNMQDCMHLPRVVKYIQHISLLWYIHTWFDTFQSFGQLLESYWTTEQLTTCQRRTTNGAISDATFVTLGVWSTLDLRVEKYSIRPHYRSEQHVTPNHRSTNVFILGRLHSHKQYTYFFSHKHYERRWIILYIKIAIITSIGETSQQDSCVSQLIQLF